VSRTHRALLLVALAQLAIGAAAVFARFALTSGGPLAVSAARLTLAAAPLLVLAALRGRLGIDRPFLLAVGTFDPRKRIALLADGARFAAMRMASVAGKCDQVSHWL